MFGLDQAAAVTHLGLYSLQHRGQESAGIVAVDGDAVARGTRKMGLVGEGLSPRELEAMPGSLAIGHTRYSTAGSS
ncbi:MAG: amidophosphoribosyltransferase, partial [Gemmatimonadaceae bacterium]